MESLIGMLGDAKTEYGNFKKVLDEKLVGLPEEHRKAFTEIQQDINSALVNLDNSKLAEARSKLNKYVNTSKG